MVKDNIPFVKRGLANQTDNVLNIIIKEKPPLFKTLNVLPERTNNWMSVQGSDDWEGLSKDQIHKRQLKFDNPEDGIRAGVISLFTRAERKNNEPYLTFNQIFFEDDGLSEDKESYKLDMISKNFTETDTIDLMDRGKLKPFIHFMINHEMGVDAYEKLKDKDKIIDKGIDMAYEYVNSDEYPFKEFIK